MTKYFPVFIFVFFTALLITVTIYYAPSWGLLDAHQLICASNFWSSNELAKNIDTLINHNAYYMPAHVVWILIAYHVFRDSPLSCYILIILVDMMGVLLWGLVLHKVFSDENNNFLLNVFIFPLSFFLFTPFWNIFMYICLQEKFIFLFSAISMYFTKKYIDTERTRYFLVSLLFIILAVLSKPQGIYIVLVYIIYSFFLLLLIRKKKRIAILILITHLILLISYYLFTVKYQLSGYGSRYTMSLSSEISNFMNAPFIIKLLSATAVFMFFYIIYKVKKQNKFSLEAIFIPLGFLCFVAVLLPWGIINYHISMAAPYVMGMFFPVYSYCNGKSRLVRLLVNCLILFLVLITFIGIIKPRISRMADIKKTVIFLKNFSNNQTGSRYFFPPPFAESAYSISVFTGLQITYVENGILSENMLGDGVNNFLIFDNQDPSIDLVGVSVEKEVYQNDNWRIYEIKKAINFRTKFTIEFKENPIERLKTYLKK